MDPATAIGTASAVLSFVDFTYRFLRVAYGIAKSTDTDDGEFSTMKTTVTQVRDMSEALLAQPLSDELPPDVARPIVLLARECRRISTKILERIARIEPASSRRFLHVAMSALRTICSREELASLQQSLDSCSAQLRFAVQSNYNAQVSASLDRLESSMEDFRDQQQRFREQTNEQCILRAVSFERMKHRQNEILAVSDNTFKWIFDDTVVAESKAAYGDKEQHSVMFREWLQHGDGIFHISGKLGSGKSALMKLLVGHKKTRDMLRDWAGSASLAFGSCFFWKPGAKDQKSTSGLVRSLLHDVLDQQRRLIPFLFPDLWNPSEHGVWAAGPPPQLLDETIKRAFQTLCDADTLAQFDVRMCCFIDGLDEFDDDHEIHIDLVDALNDWVRMSGGRVKLCVSSRELPVFQTRLAAAHRIRMQNLNHQDISDYVRLRLERQIQEPGCLEDPRISLLCREIIARADGIFLWTVLVMKLIGDKRVRPGEPVDHVLRAVRGLPRELQSLVGSLLESVAEDERPAVAACLSYTTFVSQHGFSELGAAFLSGIRDCELFHMLSLLRFYFLRRLAEDCHLDPFSPECAARGSLAVFTSQTLCQALRATKEWIMGQCKGLLEVESSAASDRAPQSGTSIACPDELFLLQVKCTHRALHEYFVEHIASSWGLSPTPSDRLGAYTGAAMCVYSTLPLAPATISSVYLAYDRSYDIPALEPQTVDMLATFCSYVDDKVKASGAEIDRLGDAQFAARHAAFPLCERIVRSRHVDDRSTVSECLSLAMDVTGYRYASRRPLSAKSSRELVAQYTEHMWPLCRLLLERGADLCHRASAFNKGDTRSPWNCILSICTYSDSDSPAEAVDFCWTTLQIFVEHARTLPSFQIAKNAETCSDDVFVAVDGRVGKLIAPGRGVDWGAKTSHAFFSSFGKEASLADFIRFFHPPNERVLLDMVWRIENPNSTRPAMLKHNEAAGDNGMARTTREPRGLLAAFDAWVLCAFTALACLVLSYYIVS